MSRWYIIRLFLKLGCFQTVLSHNVRCPEALEVEILSKYMNCTIDSPFHCLQLQGRENTYKHVCLSWQWVAAGFYPILNGEYIDYRTCPSDSYQPFAQKSNDSHSCQHQKSICSEEGQLTTDSVNTTTDRTCYCDTSKGYVHDHPTPSCLPSEYDCSCVKRECQNDDEINKDHHCEQSNTGIVNTGIKEVNNLHRTPTKYPVIFQDIPEQMLSGRKYVNYLYLAISPVVLFCLGLVLIVCLMYSSIEETQKEEQKLPLERVTGHEKKLSDAEASRIIENQRTTTKISKGGDSITIRGKYVKPEGHFATLEAKIISYRPVKNQKWYKRTNGKDVIIPPGVGVKPKYKIDQDLHSLTINKLEPVDIGTYILKANIADDYIECETFLDVTKST